MGLLIMAVYDTVENQRTKYTIETLNSLIQTVDFNKHRLFISDNNSCEETKEFYDVFLDKFNNTFGKHNLLLKFNHTNIGTAQAVNFGIKERKEGECVIKMDNDVVIHQSGWVEEMEECFRRQPLIGVLGLKRVDLEQHPNHDNEWFRTRFVLLPRKHGDSWLIVEQSADVMGTCTMLNHLLLDKIGYYEQPSIYGYDDSILNVKSELAGFKNAFLSHIKISHIDDGQNPYTQEKQKISGDKMGEFSRIVNALRSGAKQLYYTPFTDNENI